MDTRVLKYFIAVAKLGNVTKAAEQLHITQPTLSRQINELEKEIGVDLFDRVNHRLVLTKSGALFQQRAQTILDFILQTKSKLQNQDNDLSGTIRLGCVESSVSIFAMNMIEKMQRKYPHIKFDIYTANGNDLKEKLDQDLLDLIILIEPIEAAKYHYLQLPNKDQWGLIVKKDSKLAKKDSITAKDLYHIPIAFTKRNLVRDELIDILKLDANKLNLRSTHNLAGNSLLLVKSGLFSMVSIKGILDVYNSEGLSFIPFKPFTLANHITAWKKNSYLSPATEKFIQLIAEEINFVPKK
ncbi:DNA-binding transcriptional LysR family regulator [Lactobacillus colini]|uniref:DNA-binding transcriptional LysR family regulator n=1 Tax=Lactobacillus colini TaxID=1819254 RepID=A0ABS4MDI8_9LACO|nr:LysR family transcriptional regulator [Lactobacillus colini]MBP2057745.1 DNA-binding transcriptional LysR family regulator [Lactobacillus colini]